MSAETRVVCTHNLYLALFTYFLTNIKFFVFLFSVPSTPLIKIVSQTSTSSTLQIINPAGKVRFYRIIINRNTSLPLIPYQTSNQNYNITNLKPGAHYSISAVAISNGINSSQSSEINVFTGIYQSHNVRFKKKHSKAVLGLFCLHVKLSIL